VATGNCIGCFENKIVTDAVMFTDVGIAGFGQSGYHIGKGQLFIADKTEIAGKQTNKKQTRKQMHRR